MQTLGHIDPIHENRTIMPCDGRDHGNDMGCPLLNTNAVTHTTSVRMTTDIRDRIDAELVKREWYASGK